MPQRGVRQQTACSKSADIRLAACYCGLFSICFSAFSTFLPCLMAFWASQQAAFPRLQHCTGGSSIPRHRLYCLQSSRSRLLISCPIFGNVYARRSLTLCITIAAARLRQPAARAAPSLLHMRQACAGMLSKEIIPIPN